MGSRFSSGGNSNGEGTDQPLTGAATTVIATPQPSSSATQRLPSSVGLQINQPRPPDVRSADMRIQRVAAPKNVRLPDGSAVVNGHQLLEVLSASGFSGRTVVTHSRPPEAGNGPALSDSSGVNRPMRQMPILVAFRDVKCPICHKMIPSDDVECHLVMCLTKPRVIYNEELLAEDKDEECAICLEDLRRNDLIARLPCLCIYHKSCVDSWFEKSQSCPEHPDGTS